MSMKSKNNKLLETINTKKNTSILIIVILTVLCCRQHFLNSKIDELKRRNITTLDYQLMTWLNDELKREHWLEDPEYINTLKDVNSLLGENALSHNAKRYSRMLKQDLNPEFKFDKSGPLEIISNFYRVVE
ncbi:MAG: hypothetical protein N4A40_14515 [Tissierellales bacterium]|nr:hypothetical protein [Tissierellales bacterium]